MLQHCSLCGGHDKCWLLLLQWQLVVARNQVASIPKHANQREGRHGVVRVLLQWAASSAIRSHSGERQSFPRRHWEEDGPANFRKQQSSTPRYWFRPCVVLNDAQWHRMWNGCKKLRTLCVPSTQYRNARHTAMSLALTRRLLQAEFKTRAMRLE